MHWDFFNQKPKWVGKLNSGLYNAFPLVIIPFPPFPHFLPLKGRLSLLTLLLVFENQTWGKKFPSYYYRIFSKTFPFVVNTTALSYLAKYSDNNWIAQTILLQITLILDYL